MPTVIEIVKGYLEAHGYDGLFNPDGECACVLSDLAPADCITEECEPGYFAPCPADCGDHDWHIVPAKQEVSPVAPDGYKIGNLGPKQEGGGD